jgi:hypothetical protein
MPINLRKPPAAADAALDAAFTESQSADPAAIEAIRPGPRAKDKRAALPVFVMPIPRPNEDPAPAEFGWRYLEFAQPLPLEVWQTGQDQYTFAAAGTTRARRRLDAALERAAALVETDDRDSEFRLLVIADSYLELVWVHFAEEPESDRMFVASRCPWIGLHPADAISIPELIQALERPRRVDPA